MKTKIEKPKRLAATVKADIIKPVGCSWDEAGERLRATQRAGFRVLNAVAENLRLADRESLNKSGARLTGAQLQTMSYQLAGAAVSTDPAAASIGSGPQLGWAGLAYERTMDWRKYSWQKSGPSFRGTATIELGKTLLGMSPTQRRRLARER